MLKDFSKIAKGNFIFLCLFSYIFILYLPYILHGGLIIDDWGILHKYEETHSCWGMFFSFLSVFAYRPFCILLFSITSSIFKNCIPGYIIFNILIWLSTVSIISIVFSKFLGRQFLIFFIIFAVTPIISTTTVFSCVTLVSYNFTLFLWALSLWSEYKYLETTKATFYILSLGLILSAFFICEIILALLLFNCLLPLIYFNFNGNKFPVNKNLIFKYFLKFILPFIFILFIVVIYQKVIVPYIWLIDISRINFTFTPLNIFKFFLGWLWTLFVQTPALMFSSLWYFDIKKLLNINYIAYFISLFLLFKELKIQNEEKSDKYDKFYILMFFFVLLGTSSLFILGQLVATVSGYPNRLMLPTWILLAFIFALFARKIIYKRFYNVIVFVLMFLISLSFMIQRDNYISSWKLQNEIINNFKILSDRYELISGAIVIGHIQPVLPCNYNNEDVFANPWDFGVALNMNTNGKVKDGAIITKDTIEVGKLSIEKNRFIIDDWWIVNEKDFENLWFFDYNYSYPDKSKLIKVKNISHFLEISEGVRNSSIKFREPFHTKNYGFEVAMFIREKLYWLIGKKVN